MATKKEAIAETENKPEKATVAMTAPVGIADGFELIDGGEIAPGWLPQQSAKNTRDADSIRLERIENGKIETVSDSVKGEFCQITAWNKQVYALRNAVDLEGKTFPLLRLPESKGLYQSLGFKAMGAPLQIVYRGTVKVDKGVAHKWDVYVKDAAINQLSAPRPDALILLSEAQKEHIEKLDELRAELSALQTTQELRQLERQKQKLLMGGPVIDNEPDFDDMDAAFGPISGKR